MRLTQPCSCPSLLSPLNATPFLHRHLTKELITSKPTLFPHPNATMKYTASGMILHAHADASYLFEPKARSRAGGFYFLSSKPKYPESSTDPPFQLNGAIETKSKILDVVMLSAQEAKTGAGFYNAKESFPLRQPLIDLGHPQGPAQLQFDNESTTPILKAIVSQNQWTCTSTTERSSSSSISTGGKAIKTT